MFFKFIKSRISINKERTQKLKSEGKNIFGEISKKYKQDQADFAALKGRPETDGAKNLRIFRRKLLPLALVFSLVIAFNGLFAVSIVKGSSMFPTLKDGDFVLINRIDPILYGDVVVINDKEKFPDSQTVIKRVIALPGDSIECINGNVYVNNELADQPFLYSKTESFSKKTVSDSCIFVMGDNRENSVDSRKVGEISIEKVIGRVVGLNPHERDYKNEQESVINEVTKKL